MNDAIAYHVSRRRYLNKLRDRTWGRWLGDSLLRIVQPFLPVRCLCPDGVQFPSGNVLVMGRSRVLLAGRHVFLNIAGRIDAFLADAELYYLQEEAEQLLFLSAERQQVYVRPPRTLRRLPGEWVSICHPASANWMHWLSECLPAVMAISEDPGLAGCGIIYDASLPPSARASIEICAPGRKLCPLESGDAIMPEHLHPLPGDSAGWCFGWPRAGETSGRFSFAVKWLRSARRHVLRHFNIRPEPRRRLFVNRRSSFRVIENQQNLRCCIEGHGFETVDPGGMTLGEQVRLFSECETLVCQAGAAMANIMFMPERSTVVCMHADSRYANERYFSDYAAAFGVGVRYVRGQVVRPDAYDSRLIGDVRHPMNAVFRLPWEDLRRILQESSPRAPSNPAVSNDR